MSKIKRIASFLISLSLIAGIVQQPISALNTTVPQSTPILNENEAMEILNEQVDPEEYMVGEDAYKVYWDSIPNLGLAPGEPSSSYKITTEDGREMPLYTVKKDDDTDITTTYYLYCVYNYRTFRLHDSYYSHDVINGYNCFLFYTTLPYSNGGEMEVIGFTSDGLPVPNTICDPRCMRNYTLEQCKNGGSISITSTSGETKNIAFNGMGNLWFATSIGGTYKSRWASYGAYDYPIKSGEFKTNNLKDALQTVPMAYYGDGQSGYRETNENDPTAFILVDGNYLVPRRIISAYSLAIQGTPTPIGITTFIGDSGPSGQNGRPRGLWEPLNTKYLPWMGQLGEFGAATESNRMVSYGGTINEKYIDKNGKFKDFKNLKSVTFTHDDIMAMGSLFSEDQFKIYKNFTFYNVGAKGTYYYLDPENEEYAKAYGLIRTWNYIMGGHNENDTGNYLNPRDTDSTVQSTNMGQDFGWAALMIDPQQSLGEYGTNITDFHIDDKYFFVGPVQKNIYSDLIESFMNAGNDEATAIYKAEAYMNCVDTGKFLYFLQFFSADYGTIDPCTPVDESRPYTITPTISWQSNGKAGYEAGGQHYNTETLCRIYDKKVEPVPTSSLSRDLVVSGAQNDGLLKDDEYLKTNLYMVDPDITDARFQELVGVSKEKFKTLTTTILDDEAVKNGTVSNPYQGTNLESLNKAEFLECFKIVDPLKDKLEEDNAYILQSVVYSTGSADNMDGYIDDKNAYYSSYHEKIYMGFNLDYLTEGMQPSARKPIGELNDGTLNHFPFPQSIYEQDSGTDLLGEALVKAASTGNATAQKIATSGDRLQLLGITKNQGNAMTTSTEIAFEPYQPTGAEEGPTPDTLKIYRVIIHTPKETETKDGKIKINTFLYNLNSSHDSSSNIYANDTIDGREGEYVDLLYDIYTKAAERTLSKYTGGERASREKILNEVKAKPNKADTLGDIARYFGEDVYNELGANFWWLFMNHNSNVNPYNDGVTMTYSLNPPATPAQRNLKILFCTVYGSADNGLTWTQFYRSTPIDHSYFNTATGKYEIDLISMGMELNTAQDYFIAVAQQYDTVFDEALKETLTSDELMNLPNSLGPDHSLYMYGFINSIGGGKTEERNRIYFDYPTADNAQPWTDTEVNEHLNKPTGYFRSTANSTPEVTAAVQNWREDYGPGTRENQILHGKYYEELINAGGNRVKHKADGTAYIDDTYIFGVHPDWSNNTDDTQNNNTSFPLPCDDCEDPEELIVKYRFSNGKDFDNKISEIYLIDREGNRIDTTEDCFAPGKITDIDINSSDPYFSTVENLADHSYSLVVKVERNITGKEHKDIGGQCELSFIGNLFGVEYTETSPLKLDLAYGSGNITNDKHNVSSPVYNNGNSLIKNGDYITYYVNGLLPIQDTEICGTFIFKHREEDGTLSTNDLNMLNNYKKGAVDWGPLDYIVSNLVIWPDQVYATEDQVWLPEDGSDLVHFSCTVEAQYMAPDGSRPIIKNAALNTNFTLHLETRTGIGGDYVESGTVFKIENLELTINEGARTITGIAKTNRKAINDQLDIVNEGSPIRYNKNYAYRFVARINGGNGITETSSIHEHPEDQKVKMETVRTNNKDIAYFEMKSTPPDEEPLCPTPHTRNDWSITFYWTECPTPHQYTCCSGKPQNCRTCCTGTGCHSWNETKDYWETYEMKGEIRTTANGWKWEALGGNTELRAGQKFQVRIISEYKTNRNELPAPDPYGGCTWRSRYPGHAYTPAYRYIRAKLINTEGGQIKPFRSNRGGHYQITESDIYYVPEDTKNLKLTVIAETAPFWGIREKSNRQLCTNYKAEFSINMPLPIIEGSQEIV